MWEKLLELGQPMNMPWLILGDFNCVNRRQKNSLELHRPGMSSKILPIAASRSDLMMPPQRDATLLGTPTMRAIPCGPKPFRFFNMWADHQDFMATVENGWNLNVDGTAQFCLCRKLKALKGHLNAFNNLHFSHISVRAKDTDLALQDAQIQLESNPENATIRDSVRELRKKAVFLAEAERHFYYQKAKLHFLKMGNRNTKFFHDMVKRNAANCSILAITKTDGTTITSAMEIGQEFVSYFTSLLGTEVPTLPVDNAVFNWGPKLSSELALELCRVVTPEEVKQAIFHISDNKAPEPDGYSACLFKRAWHIVGDQICTAVLDFFRSGRLLRQLNHSIIALVPKLDHCPTVADYRPISCCNVIYKAITKIIADRLATALEHLTDRCQTAFIGGRSITDNIFLAQEIVRQYTRKRISPRCTINVDLRKAFDSVSWTFLSQVLHGYGFPPIFIAWIMECVSTSSFSVALNGSLHGFFAGKKGLRQGDPMSPGLFLLCMEYFSRLIKRKTTDSDFNFHPKCEKLKITHLLFVDDLMMFSRGDLPSVHILMECLQEFWDVSGLAVNTSKSSIFTAGIENNILCDILARTEFTRGEMPVRYLGIPLAAQRLSVRDYSPLVNQIHRVEL
ncbi:UNVERIFIED_CONTAM: Retrovirus-related Pol polyprotein from type-2 retrotransposable element R2DM [Sesamum calycinum]|uniref:Retrovirus-related Pol polyprotein from type-2 retrotransposable element R2DM n=1 Tax=Sesamum calycinum TaxID=2727403 RepID=A0AAW2K1T9_9LAMI